MTSTRCKTTTKPRRSQSSLSNYHQNSKRSAWELSEATGRDGNIKIWHFWGTYFLRVCQIRLLWTHTLTTTIGPCHDTGRHACLRSARKTLQKWKRCTQREGMTCGRCQLFNENELSAGRGSGKVYSRSSLIWWTDSETRVAIGGVRL